MSGIAVVIVSYGLSASEIAATLSSVNGDPRVVEVVVVDNSGTLSIDELPDRRLKVHRSPSNLGFGAGQNIGVQMTSAPLILMLNPDASLVPGALDAGARELAEHDDAAAVQGVCRQPNGSPDRSSGIEIGPLHLVARALELKRLIRTRPGQILASAFSWSRDHVTRIPRQPVDVEYLAATALLVRRRAFDAVGGFDERYFLYGEDLDLCRRLRSAGWRLRAMPNEWVIHRGGGSFANEVTREVEWWRGTLLFAAIWWSRLAWWIAVQACLLRAFTMSPRFASNLRVLRVALRAARNERRVRGRG